MELELTKRLAAALIVGLLVGTERGWKERAMEEGSRVAGIRTFGLFGFLGGVTGVMAHGFGIMAFGLGFVGVALLLASSYMISAKAVGKDLGLTTEVAALLTFSLGALAGAGYPRIAISGAVVAVFLLEMKPTLHGWLRTLEANELEAAVKLLFISVVMLPILPNNGYGPWNSLNPYEIWWMVVLVASISFIGYFAIKITGPRFGVLLTAISGGLVSSTAVTLDLSRAARRHPGSSSLMAAGIVAASATMFPRIVLEVAVVNDAMVRSILAPMMVMTVVAYAVAFILWYVSRNGKKSEPLNLENPVELATAIKFGAFLAVVMVLANALKNWFGNSGVYSLAAFSGISDVDAITLSLSRMARSELSHQIASHGIILAAIVNTIVKGGMAIFIGGPEMIKRVGLGFMVVLLAGLGAMVLW